MKVTNADNRRPEPCYLYSALREARERGAKPGSLEHLPARSGSVRAGPAWSIHSTGIYAKLDSRSIEKRLGLLGRRERWQACKSPAADGRDATAWTIEALPVQERRKARTPRTSPLPRSAKPSSACRST